ncbi:hypothetical protein JOD97_000880 [Duganella sp. 1411]|uniref:hypothetical protein n=1 Tax=Duganella sp. 1411 TaxID=2806572 RepID=UPI001AE95E93|nr:hypothetical protein [Duganella sp. 1411]MBP1202866.1 hypothetical protein [Duganella sp. 1411]
MQHLWIDNGGLRRHAIAAALAVLLAPAAAVAAATDAADTGAAVAPARTAPVYSVINLSPDASTALLNERGQAAFGSAGAGGANGFFDGDRVHDIGSLGGGYTWINGLNDNGVVVGQSLDRDWHGNVLGFAWTLRDGMRALPGDSVSTARDINDRNVIVGDTPAPGVSARAVRWNPDGTITPLGPLPLSLSEAFAVNELNVSTGFADVASGDIHATLWDKDGALTDLGTLGGGRAFGLHINERNEVAGESDNATDERVLGFFWSRRSGMVPIDVEGGGTALVAGLNDRGEVIGNADRGDRDTAYLWTLARGLTPLPPGTATHTGVRDINNKSEMVGWTIRSGRDWHDSRAALWQSAGALPVDLNTRLHRPPAGLVLRAGAAINEAGTILAYSNAGLVMLRPGKTGTDAPVLGPLLGLAPTLEVGQDVVVTAGFVDNARTQTHTGSATWTDGCPAPAPVVHEANGVGELRLRHRLCAAGYHLLTARVTDTDGLYAEARQEIVVASATIAALAGKGSLPGGASLGRGHRDLPLAFALWAPLGSGAAAGEPVVSLSGPFQFRSDQMTTTASGHRARVEGTGRLNGRDGYRFVVEASGGEGAGATGAGPDRLRVRVTHVDAVTGAEALDYDNGARAGGNAVAAPDRTAVAAGGLTLRH